jgi:hypothetical protein
VITGNLETARHSLRGHGDPQALEDERCRHEEGAEQHGQGELSARGVPVAMSGAERENAERQVEEDRGEDTRRDAGEHQRGHRVHDDVEQDRAGDAEPKQHRPRQGRRQAEAEERLRSRPRTATR